VLAQVAHHSSRRERRWANGKGKASRGL
jgi:hypothetical protein